VHGESASRIIANYSFLQTTFEQYKDLTNNTEMKSRIISVAVQMKTFGTTFAELILKHSSKILQHSYLSAAEGQVIFLEKKRFNTE